MDRERELRLVALLKAGDVDAFDEIHSTLNDRLFNFLCRLTNQRDVAEDLLEETWLRLVTHAQRLREDTNLPAWLFTVARNLHVSYCRSRLLEGSRAGDLIGLWPSGTPARTPFDVAESSELQRQIAQAFASLPTIYREALLLVGVEGMQAADAAGICGVTPEAMRQRASRGRALLARRLEELQAPPTGLVSGVAT